jgi:hypothetical protein
MHQVTVYVDPVGASAIGWSQAAGMPGDTRFDFKTPGNFAYPGIAEMYPQLVLRPFTRPHVHAYDIEINDPTGASGIAVIPGVVMNDRFQVEVYSRNADGAPQRMLASGRVDVTGYSYTSTGPLGPASFPTGPAGPTGATGATGAQGPEGDPGPRGSRWYTGAGAPSDTIPPGERVQGDMWLDEMTGDVWRWDGGAWRAFKGV